jgi:hypothetical protein
MSLRKAALVVVITALTALLSPLSAQAAPKSASGTTCHLPESDAEALVILNNYYPNRYTWDPHRPDDRCPSPARHLPGVSRRHQYRDRDLG